jgi:hypothetical protein
MTFQQGIHGVVLFSAYAVLWLAFYVLLGFGWLEL